MLSISCDPRCLVNGKQKKKKPLVYGLKKPIAWQDSCPEMAIRVCKKEAMTNDEGTKRYIGTLPLHCAMLKTAKLQQGLTLEKRVF